MPLTIGSTFGAYEILGTLGAGGMGEVYRARDTRLKREVAIKVLPDVFSTDPERIGRFQREAELLASLNHPNIAGVYGIEHAGDTRAIVMELVEGKTLAERLRQAAGGGPMGGGRRGLPLDDLLPIARQIALALEAAHDKGVIHRDLKPANVQVTPDGTVKVLDFGLAKLADVDPSSSSLTMSPTLGVEATSAGVILGTAAYMSPEQARGKPIDRRTDVWAFGCVVFEMLTGRRAFASEGDTVSDAVAAILKNEPDWNALAADTPPHIRRLLRRCLQKDAQKRLPHIGVARLEIDEALSEPLVATAPSATKTRDTRHGWTLAALTTAAAAVLVVPAVRHLRETPLRLPAEMRLQIETPSTAVPLEFALSPEGRHIVFVASGDGPQRLWLRALDRTDPQSMAGTEGAEYPFWSADSRSIGFFASSKLQRIDIAGGPPQVLANAGFGLGGAWNADGTIVFAAASTNALTRIAASGGEPVAVTRLDPPHQTSHRFPQFLPDGRHFLFYVLGDAESAGIYLGSLDGGQPKRLTAADTAGAYLPADRLVFVRQGTLVARRLDVVRGELTGDTITVADLVGYDANGFGGFSVSMDGQVAYRPNVAGRRRLIWFDRTGKTLGVAGEPDDNGLLNPELSPDGRRVAVQRTVQNNSDVWLMDLLRGGFARFTFDTAQENLPLWSPDGMRIAFISNRKGTLNLYAKPANGTGAEELLLETPNIKAGQDWSKDGRFLLYYEIDPKTGRDLWALDLESRDRARRVIANTPFEEWNGQLSSDGRWVAYATNESGRFEIVVQPFPDPTAKWQVSTTGGVQPRWRADGKELYFIAPDGKLMAVPITTTLERGPAFDAGTPVALFSARTVSGQDASFLPQYAVSRDGRFLINQSAEETAALPITLILNWKPSTK